MSRYRKLSFWVVIVWSLLLQGCASITTDTQDQETTYSIHQAPYHPVRVASAMREVLEAQTDEQKVYFQINLLKQVMQRDHLHLQSTLISQLDDDTLPEQLVQELVILKAQHYFLKRHYQKSNELLRTLEVDTLSQEQLMLMLRMKARLARRANQVLKYLNHLQQLQALGEAQSLDPKRIGHAMDQFSKRALKKAVTLTEEGMAQGWIQLALVNKLMSYNPQRGLDQLKLWKQRFSSHPGLSLISEHDLKERDPSLQIQHAERIAFLLPFHGKMANVSNAIVQGFTLARRSTNQSLLTVSVFDTSKDSIDRVYAQAVDAGAELIIGPLLKKNVSELLKQQMLSRPTLLLNQIDDHNEHPLAFQFSLSQTEQAVGLAKKARHFGHARVIVIEEDRSWSHKTAQAFTKAWEDLEGVVVDHMTIGHTQKYLSAKIRAMLHVTPALVRSRQLSAVLGQPLRLLAQARQDFDFIFIALSPDQAKQVVPLIHYYSGSATPCYSTSAIVTSDLKLRHNQDLHHVLFSYSPWYFGYLSPNHSKLKKMITGTWPKMSKNYGIFYAYGVDLYGLIAHIPVMKQMRATRFYGLTGTLKLDASQVIKRTMRFTLLR
jgi:outer membrane PBP1 activator LpoA protein